jgi:ATP-binding cassette subfamily C (CFTR/MRP) protein 4
MQLRVGLVAALYHKTLRLPSISIVTDKKDHDDDDDDVPSNKRNKTSTSSTSTSTATSGHITNLASNDVERFLFTSVACQYIFLGPLEAIVILLLGIYTIGPVFGAGYVLLGLVVLPLQFHLSRRFATSRSKVAALTDARITLISQAVSGNAARVVKMNGWDSELERRILQIRAEEMTQLQCASRYKALNETIYYVASLTVAVCIFTVHVLSGGTLTARNVFTTLSLLNILQFTITKHIPNAVMGLSECAIASRRIQAFLELDEQEEQQEEECWKTEAEKESCKDKSTEEDANNEEGPQQEDHCALEMTGITCYWNTIAPAKKSTDGCVTTSESSSSSNIALDNVSLQFQDAGLHCIIGKVGSGKSALLQALAGELPFQKGGMSRRGKSIAYATQDPWIMDGTVRENIIMGLPFDPYFYDKIISACGLTPDIQRMQRGDETVVGDRGVQCSGGQKARIGLARAFYCNSEILLLDDPLSAVDTKVARSIFYSAIQGLGVNRGKCVILVTHQHQFVGNHSSCTLLDRGQVVCSGSFADCVIASGGEISNALQTGEDGEALEDGDEQEEATKNEKEANRGSRDQEPTSTDDKGKETKDLEDAAQLEKRRTGTVGLSTWLSYGKAIGGLLACLAFFLSFAMTQTCLVIASIEIGKWAVVPAAEQVRTSGRVCVMHLNGTFTQRTKSCIVLRCNK